MAFKLEIDDKGFNRDVRRLVGKLENPKPALIEIGAYMQRSIQRNFKEGGRPRKWPRSVRAKMQGGQTLMDTGNLYSSINYDASSKSVAIGTNTLYAPIQHSGGVISAKRAKHLTYKIPGLGWRKSKSVRIPARPFLMFQEEDYKAIRRILKRHVERGR